MMISKACKSAFTLNCHALNRLISSHSTTPSHGAFTYTYTLNTNTSYLFNNQISSNDKRFMSTIKTKKIKQEKERVVRQKKKERLEFIEENSEFIESLPDADPMYDKDMTKVNLLFGAKASSLLKESSRAQWHLRIKNNNDQSLKSESPSETEATLSKNKQFQQVRYDEKVLTQIKEKSLGIFKLVGRKKKQTKLDAVRETVKKEVHFTKTKVGLLGSAKKVESFIEESSIPEVAFIGRSNVGKSSLINSTTQRGLAKTGNRPGTTQSINWYQISNSLRLVDLPGYGFAFAAEEKLETWGELINTYLTTRKTLKCVFVLVDPRFGLKDSDRQLLKLLDQQKIKTHVVMTKCDLMTQDHLAKRHFIITQEIEQLHHSVVPIIMVSAKNLAGMGDFLNAVKRFKLKMNPQDENELPPMVKSPLTNEERTMMKEKKMIEKKLKKKAKLQEQLSKDGSLKNKLQKQRSNKKNK
ncbi:hypothetical protein CYY_003703 [Polysphondylium violaceum]|uniref:EngB-type G domain-containing protein n=1 Tax=Polysphondylium violaceum TaxID=133409 RepID=A0A8J4PWF8_9MYCE|nr:hypothetical protein CYY_003703 [Polysphondylium violaceum]